MALHICNVIANTFWKECGLQQLPALVVRVLNFQCQVTCAATPDALSLCT